MSAENNQPEEFNMVDNIFKTVAVIGAGIIGRGWVRVFSRSGCRTRIYDPDPAQTHKALAWVAGDLKRDVSDNFISSQQAQTCLSLISLYKNGLLEKVVALPSFIIINSETLKIWVRTTTWRLYVLVWWYSNNCWYLFINYSC